MRMKKANQKMTVLTLVVALGVAVYLNWEYAKSTDLTMDVTQVNAFVTPEATNVITDALAVNAEVNQDEPVDKNYGEAQLVSVSETTGNEFFEQARLSRTKTRDEALDKLQKTLKNTELSAEEKEQLTQSLSKTIDNITIESDIESLVKAKGFIDCVAFIDEDKVNITVMTSNDGLSKEEVAQIRDIVLTKCTVSPQNITIVEVK